MRSNYGIDPLAGEREWYDARRPVPGDEAPMPRKMRGFRRSSWEQQPDGNYRSEYGNTISPRQHAGFSGKPQPAPRLTTGAPAPLYSPDELSKAYEPGGRLAGSPPARWNWKNITSPIARGIRGLFTPAPKAEAAPEVRLRQDPPVHLTPRQAMDPFFNMKRGKLYASDQTFGFDKEDQKFLLDQYTKQYPEHQKGVDAWGRGSGGSRPVGGPATSGGMKGFRPSSWTRQEDGSYKSKYGNIISADQYAQFSGGTPAVPTQQPHVSTQAVPQGMATLDTMQVVAPAPRPGMHTLDTMQVVAPHPGTPGSSGDWGHQQKSIPSSANKREAAQSPWGPTGRFVAMPWEQ